MRRHHPRQSGRRQLVAERHGDGAHPFHRLQRSAGNRAVASFVDARLQRQALPAPAGEQAASAPTGANPALVAMYQSSVVDPLRRAVPLIRAWQKTKAREELLNSKDAIKRVGQTYMESDPLLERDLAVSTNAILAFRMELKPRPVRKIADQLEAYVPTVEAKGTKLH